MRMCVLTTHLRNKHDGRVGGRACVHVCMCVSACVSGGGGEWAGVGGNGGKWGWVGWSGGGWVGGRQCHMKCSQARGAVRHLGKTACSVKSEEP